MANKKKTKLTVKQKKFCDHYIKSGNGRDAAIKAGYSKNSAGVIANENLNKPNIAKYIQERSEKLSDATIADACEIRRFWTSVMRGEPEDVEMGDRIKSSELLAKSGGMFLDRVEHSGGVDIKVEWE